MKTYKGTRSGSVSCVTVDGKQLPMFWYAGKQNGSREFAWGEASDGAELLALSIITDALGQDHAEFLSAQFREGVVEKLHADWEITDQDVKDYSDYVCAIEAAAHPNKPGRIHLPPAPRIVIDPNYRLGNKTA